MYRRLFFTLLTLTALSAAAFGAEPRSDAGKAVEQDALGASAANADAAQLKAWFQEAPSILPGAKIPLKPQPLWHTNGELSDAIIQEIFEVGQQNGFGGITFLPVSSTTPKYLTEEYFTQYGKALDLADKLSMKVVYYDDLDFPSGSAGCASKSSSRKRRLSGSTKSNGASRVLRNSRKNLRFHLATTSSTASRKGSFRRRSR